MTRTMIDLFAGCGGLSTGMEIAGFAPVFVNELNDDARATYLMNRHHKIDGVYFRDFKELQNADANNLNFAAIDRIKGILADISELNLRFPKSNSSELGNLDLLAGGPPCQGFSGIGIRRSYSVEKKDLPSNLLFKRMAFAIDQFMPKIFLFENVQGLLNAKWDKQYPEKIFPDVLATFRAISGYHVRWSLVRSKDYGVPQNRPRVLLVGIRNDVAEQNNELDLSGITDDAVASGFLPRNGPKFPDLVDLLGDLEDPEAINKLINQDFPKGDFLTAEYPELPLTQIQTDYRTKPDGTLMEKDELTEQVYSKHKRHIVEKFSYMIKSGGKIQDKDKTKKFSQRVLRHRWGNNQPNITATSLPDDYVHYSQPRILTVREWARLQTFPDWYQFAGKRTTGGIRRAGNPRENIFDREVPKYTQIGNAVPVKLAEQVGLHFEKILKNTD